MRAQTSSRSEHTTGGLSSCISPSPLENGYWRRPIGVPCALYGSNLLAVRVGNALAGMFNRFGHSIKELDPARGSPPSSVLNGRSFPAAVLLASSLKERSLIKKRDKWLVSPDAGCFTGAFNLHNRGHEGEVRTAIFEHGSVADSHASKRWRFLTWNHFINETHLVFAKMHSVICGRNG